MEFEHVVFITSEGRMRTVRHHFVLPLLNLLLIAGLTAPWLHTLSHLAHERYTPYETQRTGGTPVFHTEGCELCLLTATLTSIEFKAISVSPAFATHQHSVLAPHIVYVLLSAPTDARAPPAAAWL